MQTNFIIKNKNLRIKSLRDNITSHHTMGAFFSSQDIKMVQQEGNDTNCFVSLVVDTRGTYVAIVTRKVQTKSEVTIKKLGTSYEFFGEGTKELTHNDAETTKVIDKEVIEYFDLEVERHEVPNTLEYLDTRFEEIEKKKKEETKATLAIHKENWKSALDEEPKGFFETLHQNNKEKKEPRELSLFTGDSNPHYVFGNKDLDWQPDPKEIHTVVVHILTCNLILNPEKIDLKQWVKRHMENVYKKLFGEHSLYECANESCGAFSEWRDFIIQYTIDYFNYDDVPDAFMDGDFDLIQSRVAQAIIDEILEFVDVNPYIKSYYEALSLQVVE